MLKSHLDWGVLKLDGEEGLELRRKVRDRDLCMKVIWFALLVKDIQLKALQLLREKRIKNRALMNNPTPKLVEIKTKSKQRIQRSPQRSWRRTRRGSCL